MAEMDLVIDSAPSSARDTITSPRSSVARSSSIADDRPRSDSRRGGEKEKEREKDVVLAAKKSKSFSISSVFGLSKNKREHDEEEFVVSGPLHLMKQPSESTGNESEVLVSVYWVKLADY